MTTPRTIAGRCLVIVYGFLGCAGGILFFNLFLERIITLLAYFMRTLHERRRGSRRRDSQMSYDDNLDAWKPSVYWVLLCLFLATIVVVASGSALYSHMERWSYFESVYFCFVSFATIGFGDLVASQQPHYPISTLYRIANFLLLATGCCCIYSLFNVLSIVIKEFLNWLIKWFNCSCDCKKKQPLRPPTLRARRNALTPNHLQKPKLSTSSSDSDSERRNSGDAVSMREVLRTNKVSLAVMQKQLYESAQRGGSLLLPSRIPQKDAFKPSSVGPLAIVTQKFQD